ncbi:gallinacin-10-like [Hemicordylus capensis]|uniref:gallinacin-10-like n=1 Tax=Hemicordylus capensis TaxID=884348 RepID=UPI002304506F|nr:gallinacin-10-like [Hemicordylus capensis]
MRILFFFFAIAVLLFQVSPGYAQPPADLASTMACRAKNGFCQVSACPPTFEVSGSCHGGMNCCTKIAS